MRQDDRSRCTIAFESACPPDQWQKYQVIPELYKQV